jgi:membrane associated rhomboid family serine protease
MIGLRQTLLPAIVVIGMWAVFQFINGAGAFAVSEETTGGVAYMAHIGGFVIGLIGGALARSAGAHEVGSRAP